MQQSSQQDPEQGQRQIRGGGDPLGAMYILAAVAMGIGFIVITILIFVPRDLFDRSSPEDLYRPGSGEGWIQESPAQVLADPPGLRQVEPGVYVATMYAYNWEFEPREIRVPRGAQVTFRAISRQDYHGFALIGTPLIVSLAPDQVQELTWTFEEAGEFPFVCSDYCGGGHVSMNGRVIVE